jgi:hypothetical protein
MKGSFIMENTTVKKPSRIRSLPAWATTTPEGF